MTDWSKVAVVILMFVWFFSGGVYTAAASTTLFSNYPDRGDLWERRPFLRPVRSE